MKPQTFAVLAVAAAVSLAAAIATYTAQSPTTGATTAGAPLIPNLKTEAPRIARIEIKQGEGTVVLARKGEQWLIEDRGGFPASADKIRALLAGLVDASLAEPKTKSPERYAALELEDPAGKSANSRLIRLVDDTGAVISEVIAGKTRADAFGSGKTGTYVRKPGEEQTWLADADISGGMDLKDWTNARLFETATAKVKKAHVEPAGAPAYDIVRGEDGTHKLADMPAGKKVKYVNMIDNIIEAISFADFESVRKPDQGSGTDLGSASMETDSGLKIGLKFRRDKDDTWITVTATGEGDSKKTADDIMARASGWEFKVISVKADTILKRQEELLEDSSS